MKGGKNIFLVGIMAAGLFFFLRAKKKITQTKAFAKFVIKSVKMKGLKIFLTIGIQNPVNSKIRLNSFVGDLTMGGNAIARVTNFQPVEIQPAAETNVDLQLKPSGLGVLTVLKQIVSKKPGKMGVVLKGAANLNGATVPINMNF